MLFIIILISILIIPTYYYYYYSYYSYHSSYCFYIVIIAGVRSVPCVAQACVERTGRPSAIRRLPLPSTPPLAAHGTGREPGLRASQLEILRRI